MFGISVGELTVQAAWVAGLAILAVTLAGWRKPARAAALTPPPASAGPQISDEHSDHYGVENDHDSDGERLPVVITAAPLDVPPSPLRRMAAGAAATALSVTTGAVIAILVSFGAVAAVIWATNLLGR
jgi:hypothetical protein